MTITDKERNNGMRLLACVNAFRKLDPTMPVQYQYAFLLVMLYEGRSVGEYAQIAGQSVSVMSRHILDIGPTTRRREAGLGLVALKPAPNDLRRHEVFLTPKGARFATELSILIDKAQAS